MKKLTSSILMLIFAVSLAYASEHGSHGSHTKVEIGIAGDVYYATDNDQNTGLNMRKLSNLPSSANIYKDRISTNNVLFEAEVESTK
jgi:hypothetical protein